MSAGATRRDALKGIATAAALGAVPATAAALPRSVDRRAWDAAWANYQEAKRRSDALDSRVDAVSDAWHERLKKLPPVAEEWRVREARFALKQIVYIEDVGDNYERYRGYHALVQADDRRNAKLAELDKRLGYTAINDQWDALAEAVSNAETALLNTPAPDGEALLWKINRLYPIGDGIWAEGVEDQTHADLRRLLLNGRA